MATRYGLLRLRRIHFIVPGGGLLPDRSKWLPSNNDFIYLFLQHVLPKGFVKIRYYGFLSPGRRNLLAVIKYLLNDIGEPEVTPTVDERYICPHCGAKLRWIKPLPKSTRAPP